MSVRSIKCGVEKVQSEVRSFKYDTWIHLEQRTTFASNTHTHNYVHASSIDENSLVAEDGITLKQLPPRGTTVNTHHLILLLLRIVKNILISQLLRNDCRVAYWMYDSGRRSSGRSVGICRARTSTRSFALESTRKRGFIGQFHQSG